MHLSWEFPVLSNLLSACFPVRLRLCIWRLPCTHARPGPSSICRYLLWFVLSYVSAAEEITQPQNITSVCFRVIGNSTGRIWIAPVHLTVTIWNSRQVQTNLRWYFQVALGFSAKHRCGSVAWTCLHWTFTSFHLQFNRCMHRFEPQHVFVLLSFGPSTSFLLQFQLIRVLPAHAEVHWASATYVCTKGKQTQTLAHTHTHLPYLSQRSEIQRVAVIAASASICWSDNFEQVEELDRNFLGQPPEYKHDKISIYFYFWHLNLFIARI